MKVITFGVYDFVHIGHINLFKNCKKYGDFLIVAIQEDEYVVKNKPGTRLAYSFSKRFDIISSLDIVDSVISYKQIDEAIKEINFDILVIGPDQNNEHFKKAIEWCNTKNKKVVVIERTKGISSRELRNK